MKGWCETERKVTIESTFLYLYLETLSTLTRDQLLYDIPIENDLKSTWNTALEEIGWNIPVATFKPSSSRYFSYIQTSLNTSPLTNPASSTQ